MRSITSVVIALGVVVLSSGPVFAEHTEFEYAVDRFELDGNRHTPLDDTPGYVDEFDDGSMSGWFVAFGTAYEGDGHLVLTSPGEHFPDPNGGFLDITIVASRSQTYVYDGSGDFMATALWAEPMSFPLGHHYHLSVFTWNRATPGRSRGGSDSGFSSTTRRTSRRRPSASMAERRGRYPSRAPRSSSVAALRSSS